MQGAFEGMLFFFFFLDFIYCYKNMGIYKYQKYNCNLCYLEKNVL